MGGPVTSADRLFWCATTLLYSVLGDWYALFDAEDITPPGSVIPAGPDEGESESIASWALEESHQVNEEVVSDIDPYEMMDGHTEQWITKIWEITRSAHTSYPHIKRWQWMYFLYYQSVAQIIEEFERIVNGPPIRSSHYYRSYLDGAQKLSEYKSKLLTYLPETRESPVASAVSEIITQTAKNSATNWRSTVFSSAKSV